MIKEIEEFDGLEALRLEGNTVGVEAARVIAKALEKKSELKVRGQQRRLVLDKIPSLCSNYHLDLELSEACPGGRPPHSPLP